jgi:hypothetical protein
MKRRFILVIEFLVSVVDELVFVVAASEVYPEFHDPTRNVPIKDLTHRKLLPEIASADQSLLERLQQRGELYASVATKTHYLEYQPHSCFPIIGGGWSKNDVRALSKGGRVMVDVKRAILENHIPVRGTADGMSDTVKEAIKLFDQSKRTSLVVPFHTAVLPGFESVPRPLIRAVARNAGGGTRFDDKFDEDSDDEDDLGLDVVTNKGAAFIFLLHSPPGCGKTLTVVVVVVVVVCPVLRL